MATKPTYEELEQRIQALEQAETKLKRTETKLRESRQVMANILNTIPVRVFWKDRNLVYLGCNQLFVNDAGFTDPKEIIGKDDFQMGWRDQAKFYRNDDREVIDSGLPKLLIEEPQTTPEGKSITLLTSKIPLRSPTGEILGVLGTYMDITARKEVEKTLQQSETNFRSIMEAIKDPIYICSPDFKVEFMNPAMIKMVGHDATGEVCFNRLHGLEEKCEWCQFDMIQRGEVSELEVVSPKDKRSYLIVQSPFFRPDGSISKISVYKDITESKKMEAQFRQAQKMEAVGRLAGGVAHDYNNMLSVIIGYTELTIEKVEPSEPLHADLNEILSAAKRAASITQQLLAFARKQPIAPKVFDLNENIEGMLKMLRRLIGEDIDLLWKPGKESLRLEMDPSQIDQILANFCVNARDAISDVGKITIETNRISCDLDYCNDHAWAIPGDYVLLTFSDDGCGMDPETFNHIFEPFFTTKGIGEGTGLGLATVYGIVKQNNGFINVYSEPEKGTSFKIYLPRHTSQAVEAPLEDVAEVPLGRGETVLLVEDDAAIRRFSRKMLQDLNYTVHTATTPQGAMDLAAAHAGEIQMMITDVIMPEMNGRELANQLQTNYPDLKILFMSGYTANVIAHRGVLEESVNFLPKPFSKQDIAVKIRDVLEDPK